MKIILDPPIMTYYLMTAIIFITAVVSFLYGYKVGIWKGKICSHEGKWETFKTKQDDTFVQKRTCIRCNFTELNTQKTN